MHKLPEPTPKLHELAYLSIDHRQFRLRGCGDLLCRLRFGWPEKIGDLASVKPSCLARRMKTSRHRSASEYSR
jgi:hypothetical protein